MNSSVSPYTTGVGLIVGSRTKTKEVTTLVVIGNALSELPNRNRSFGANLHKSRSTIKLPRKGVFLKYIIDVYFK